MAPEQGDCRQSASGKQALTGLAAKARLCSRGFLEQLGFIIIDSITVNIVQHEMMELVF